MKFPLRLGAWAASRLAAPAPAAAPLAAPLAGDGGYRRVALTLRSICDADQRWLLDRLTPQQRERVTPLLAELKLLGLQFDKEDISALTAEPAPPTSALASGALPPVAGAQAAPGSDTLTRALVNEPEWLAAKVKLGAKPAVYSALLNAARQRRHEGSEP